MFKKLVVGVDFSAHSDRAVGSAIAIARASGGSVVLVHVLSKVAEVKGGDTDMRNAMQQRLTELATRLSGENKVTVDWGLVNGAAVDELNRYVELWGGDALVVGSADKSAVGKFLVGSVAEGLIHSARVPVIVIGPNAAA